MNFLVKLARKIHSLDEFVRQPHQILLRRRGVQLELYRKLHQGWLQSLRLGTVIDIGANEGQFAWAARAAWPEAQIYSFEPLPDCFERLKARFQGVSSFAAFNLALGDRNETLNFEHNTFSPSSSFLKMAPAHTAEFPHTRGSRTVTVRLERLDDIAGTLSLRPPLLIKIDVQGYEDKVIAGGERTFQDADLVIIESSFEVLYEGQPLFDDIYQKLIRLGFVYRGALDQMLSTKDGRPLQADSVFVRGQS